MAGLLREDNPKEMTCWECHFHDWNSDQCALGRRAGVIVGDEPACQSHMTDTEFDEDFTRRLEERRKRKESENGKQSNHDQTSSGA